MKHPYPHLKRSATALLTLACCALPTLAQDKEPEDVVHMRGGESQSLVIETENWDALSGRGSAAIAWDDVQSIDYAESEDLVKATELVNAGRYEAALEELDALLADTKLRKVLRQQAAYLSAVALQSSGKVDEAAAAYGELIKTFPKGRYHVRAAQAVVDALTAKQDAAGADKAIDAWIAEAAGDAPLSAALGLVKARALLARGKSAEAKPLFTAAQAAAGAPDWVGLEGRLGLAGCALRDGDTAGAEKSLRELTKLDASKQVLAGAWNGLGDLLSEQAKQKSDIDQMLDGLYCYLRGSTVYAPLPGEPNDQYERAFAGSIRCFKFVGDLEKNAEKKKLYRQRYTERLAQFEQEFPASAYLASL